MAKLVTAADKTPRAAILGRVPEPSANPPATKQARPEWRQLLAQVTTLERLVQQLEETGTLDADGFVGTDEFCRMIGISKSKANKDRLTGDSCPFYKIGSRVVYKRSDVFDWMAGKRRRSTSDQ